MSKPEYDKLIQFNHKERKCKRIVPCITIYQRNNYYTYIYYCAAQCPYHEEIKKCLREAKLLPNDTLKLMWMYNEYRIRLRKHDKPKVERFINLLEKNGFKK